jgi:peptidyl-tRNA hydrolase
LTQDNVMQRAVSASLSLQPLLTHQQARVAGKKSLAYKLDKNLPGWYAEVDLTHGKETFTLMFFKPKAYMNLNGAPILKAAKSFLPSMSRGKNKGPALLVAPVRLDIISQPGRLVLHDDLQRPIGKATLQEGGKEAGHNGLRDVSSAFRTHDYWRMRLGIGRPANKTSVTTYVCESRRRFLLRDSSTAVDPLTTAEINSVRFDEFTGRSGPVLDEVWSSLEDVMEQLGQTKP